MTISLDEHRALQRERAVPASRITELRGLQQEQVRAAALTGHEHWDLFLRYIEAQIRMTEAETEVRRRQAASLVLVDEAKARAAAVQVTVLEARATTLKEVILLPKLLIAQGEKAAKLVAELDVPV